MRKIRGNAISMIFQEPMTSLNPVLTIGRQIAEALVAASRVVARAGGAARDRAAAAGQDPGAGAPRVAISASAFRRHAPARDDRDGARLRAAPADRRRADDRARRDDPGADPRPDARAAAEDRRGDRAHHARSRRRRRDGASASSSCMPGARSRRRRWPSCSRARGIRIRAACSIRFRSSARQRRWCRGARSGWPKSPAPCRRFREPIVGCAFAPALRFCDRALPQRIAAARGRRRRRISRRAGNRDRVVAERVLRRPLHTNRRRRTSAADGRTS